MKTILIFRHGKSDWNADFDTDHDRPLARRGKKASKSMGKWLSNTKQQPDFCYVSSSRRTRQTYELAAKAGDWTAPMEIRESLYLSDVDAYLAVIEEASDDTNCILLVGHEPTCSMTTSALVGGGTIRFPTATMARIDVEMTSWKHVRDSVGLLIWLQPPRFLVK